MAEKYGGGGGGGQRGLEPPLLFIIYINDLPQATPLFKVVMFSDDSKIFMNITNESDCHILQLELNWLYEWSKNKELLFNEQKCRTLHIGKKKCIPFNYSVAEK